MSIYTAYSDYVAKMTEAWETLCYDLPFDNVFEGLSNSSNRDYNKYGTLSSRDGLRGILRHTGLGFVYYSGKIPGYWKDLGLLSITGSLVLNERYIVPIRDPVGNIIGIVGWKKNAAHKYVTCVSPEINIRNMWFGLEQATPEGCAKMGLEYHSNRAILCEGIFDTLSARSLGIPAYGAMGIRLTQPQIDMEPFLAMGGRLLGITDMDKQGNNGVHWDNWSLYKNNGSYFRFNESPEEGIVLKDIDDFVSYYGEKKAYEVINAAFKSKSKVIRFL
jgi:DNA primase